MSVSPTLYAEYDCSGPGVSATRANGGTIMTKAEAIPYYYLSAIFDSTSKTDSPFADTWIPAADSAQILLPVEMTSFSAAASANEVVLSWKTATEINSYGFQVERMVANGSWKQIGFVNGAGNSNSIKVYSFTDKGLTSGKYMYRLKIVDQDGSYKYSSTVEIAVKSITAFALSQNYPNPFNPSTVITFAIKADSHVTLELFSVSGQKIATLIDENRTANTFDYELNMNKYNLPSGVYFYRLTGTETATGKVQVATKKLAYIR